ncbi:hypothetical protein N665_0496s0012 [Sinapis alba]|nr:hypothetical protein N665_0496s0012 [Sinapis alba]
MNHRKPLGFQGPSYLLGKLQLLQRAPKAATTGEDEIECLVLERYSVSLASHHQRPKSFLGDPDGVLHPNLPQGENILPCSGLYTESIGFRGEVTVGDEILKDGGVELNGLDPIPAGEEVSARGGSRSDGGRAGRSSAGDDEVEILREREKAEVATVA